MRERVGLLELSSFSKYEVRGPGAAAFLDRLCANRLPRPGRIALAQLLNDRGTVESDVTVTRLGLERFLLVSAAVAGLQNDASPQAVRLLVRALETSTNPTVWSHITNALGNFGTPECKQALNKARDSDNPTKRSLALTALRTLRQRRPIFALEFEGKRYDTGDKLGFLKATVDFALARPDLGDEFRAYLKGLGL